MPETGHQEMKRPNLEAQRVGIRNSDSVNGARNSTTMAEKVWTWRVRLGSPGQPGYKDGRYTLGHVQINTSNICSSFLAP